jgi:ribonuclease VapC
VIDYTAEHAAIALDAFARFGKGRHKAALNFGDCVTYAAARYASESLLAVGDDFAHTDLVFDSSGVVGRWAERS